jgi:hypothetical protein
VDNGQLIRAISVKAMHMPRWLRDEEAAQGTANLWHVHAKTMLILLSWPDLTC